MNLELEATKKKNIWELADLPNRGNKIRVKWVYKTKRNENGEVDKYKARLVTKGYAQQHRVDYIEVFTHMACLDTI
jgi:hypothetical protein